MWPKGRLELHPAVKTPLSQHHISDPCVHASAPECTFPLGSTLVPLFWKYKCADNNLSAFLFMRSLVWFQPWVKRKPNWPLALTLLCCFTMVCTNIVKCIICPCYEFMLSIVCFKNQCCWIQQLYSISKMHRDLYVRSLGGRKEHLM